MGLEKVDLVIRYDEEEQKLKFYSASPGENGTVLPRRLPHLELELSKLRTKVPDEAERIVGGSVLVFFEFHSRTKTGIRDYSTLGKQFAKSSFDDARQAAAKSDPDAQFELAMHHLDKSIEDGLRTDLELAEKWLQTSAANGSHDAQEYLREHWGRMKAYAERRIADRE
jgi:TPR repeat protein